MNRPYYALAALVVVLGGSAVAVGSARCQTTTASATSSRALCASSARDLVVAAHLFVQFDTSWEASRRAIFAGSEQGRDGGYDDSCGYDPYRGERYDAETGGGNASTFAEEVESWPSDERIDSGFRQFEGCKAQSVCGGNEIHCPYLGGRSVEQSLDCLNNGSADDVIANAEDECHQEYQRWLAEQEAADRTTSSQISDESAFFAESVGDESAFFAEPSGDAWKTAPVSMPEWISDYLSALMPSLEEQYAQAELQAFRDAAASEHGPSLSAAPARERAAYKDEYESLYNLDAYLIPEREEMAEEAAESVETDNGPVVWSLGRIFGKVFQMAEEILPLVEEEAEELYDAADEALQQWGDFASQLAMPRDDVPVFGPYSGEFDDAIISRDRQIIDVQPTLPIEAAQSREMLASLAGSLRAAGQLLLTVADGLEAEAERVLSAELEEYWSR